MLPECKYPFNVGTQVWSPIYHVVELLLYGREIKLFENSILSIFHLPGFFKIRQFEIICSRSFAIKRMKIDLNQVLVQVDH